MYLPSEDRTRALARYNQHRLQPGVVLDYYQDEIPYIEEIRDIVRDDLKIALGCGEASAGFYSSLLHCGPGQGDRLFPWLANYATKEQMVWFLSQEAAGEAGFDDLVAMTQVKMPTRAKLEMARNYWDEMGRGEEAGMHGKLLHQVVEYFGIGSRIEETVEEALLLNNLMTGLACNRRYAYLSAGALGVIEMTAPGRVSLVDQGLKRLGVPTANRVYFTLHAALDVKHSREWNAEVIEPLADHIGELVEGAYLRLWAGARCFERYRKELGVST